MAIYTVHDGTLEYLASDTIAVPHAFTSRIGGVSAGALGQLNLGIHRGDDPERVLENYRILCASLGCSPEDTVLTKQVHSDIVLTVGRDDRGTGLFRPQETPCDALITNAPDVALVVFTADCTPILLYDPVAGAVGAVHAGWRGTASAIAEKTVQAMTREFGTRPEDIRAAIGPNIGRCCFETGDDVPEIMLDSLGDGAGRYIFPWGKKFHLDLKGLNAWILQEAGVRHIDISNSCTACRPDRFWSHRIAGDHRGSQGAIILNREVFQ